MKSTAYPPISREFEYVIGRNRGPPFLDFHPDLSNRIIIDLVSQLKEYERVRGLYSDIREEGGRIVQVDIGSFDKTIDGSIVYIAKTDEKNGTIKGTLHFKVEDPTCQVEYKNLERMLRKALPDDVHP